MSSSARVDQRYRSCYFNRRAAFVSRHDDVTILNTADPWIKPGCRRFVRLKLTVASELIPSGRRDPVNNDRSEQRSPKFAHASSAPARRGRMRRDRRIDFRGMIREKTGKSSTRHVRVSRRSAKLPSCVQGTGGQQRMREERERERRGRRTRMYDKKYICRSSLLRLASARRKLFSKSSLKQLCKR